MMTYYLIISPPHDGPGITRQHMHRIAQAHIKSCLVHINATQSVHALMCEREHTVPHVQKITYYAHKYTHMRHFTHAHDIVGFQ